MEVKQNSIEIVSFRRGIGSLDLLCMGPLFPYSCMCIRQIISCNKSQINLLSGYINEF